MVNDGHGYANLVAMDGPSNTEKWRYPVGDSHTCSPAVAPDGTIYVCRKLGKLWMNGGEDSLEKVFALRRDGTLKWAWIGSREACGCESSPAVDSKGRVLVQCNCAGTFCLSSSGQLVWSGVDGAVFNSPSIDLADNVYIASSSVIIKVDSSGGTTRIAAADNWMYDSCATISTDGRVIYRGDNAGVLYAFKSTGGVLWKTKLMAGNFHYPPALSGNGIVYCAAGSRLYALDAATGQVLWNYLFGAATGVIACGPALADDGTLYVIAQLGSDVRSKVNLYAFQDPNKMLFKKPRVVGKSLVVDLECLRGGSVVMEISEDLSKWMPVRTNNVSTGTNVMSLDLLTASGFVRARVQ